MNKHVIVGLGNVGKAYEYTRHNAGFLAVDALAARYGFPKFTHDPQLHAWVSGMPIGETVYLLAKPDTLMNRSGMAVSAILHYYKLEPADVTVIYDDIDLPLGTLRRRETGSAGTHNGMRSIVQETGTQDIPRIRLGIKPDHPTPDLAGFVLGRMGEAERASLATVIEEITLPLGDA